MHGYISHYIIKKIDCYSKLTSYLSGITNDLARGNSIFASLCWFAIKLSLNHEKTAKENNEKGPN